MKAEEFKMEQLKCQECGKPLKRKNAMTFKFTLQSKTVCKTCYKTLKGLHG
jgi:formylmethanofuran dehydrogenase subunit E